MKNFRSIVSIVRFSFILAVFAVGSLPHPAMAVGGYDIDFYQSNDILYYNPSGTACTTAAKSYTTNLDIPSLVGNDNAEKIWNFLTSGDRGLTAEQAAGVMGNIEQESGYKPDLEEGPDSYNRHSVRPVGYGIVQWTGPRRIALEAAASDQSVAVSDLGFQLGFMFQESSSRQVTSDVAGQGYGTAGDNEWETLKKQKTVEDATVFWHNNFEVSADTPQEVLANRGKYAQNAYESFKDKTGTGSTTASTSGGSGCTPSSFAGGDLIETLLAYAWPEFHENNWDTPVPGPKPAYLEVATKLTKEGKWVGGGQAEIGIPGIDCGGFVSILLTQSGFEPDYNYGLDMSKGASNQQFGQLPWAQDHWTFLGNGGSINVSDLRPGDVAYNSGHTFVFVGQVDGFDSQYASASYDWWRSPMSAGSFETATNPEYIWYGKRGNDNGSTEKPNNSPNPNFPGGPS